MIAKSCRIWDSEKCWVIYTFLGIWMHFGKLDKLYCNSITVSKNVYVISQSVHVEIDYFYIKEDHSTK